MSTPFDRVITGTVVTTEAIIRQGYVAVRGETIAAIGQGDTSARHGNDLPW